MSIKAFKKQQDIQMETMESMMKDQAGMNTQGQEGQVMMMMKMMVHQARAADKLFEEIGVEEEELNESIQKLNL